MQVSLEEWLVALRQAGVSPATVETYQWHVNKLAEWLAEQGIETVGGVSKTLLRQWGAGLHEGWRPATVKTAVIATRSFFSWCVEEKLIAESPAGALKAPKVKPQVQRTVSVVEVARVVAGCDRSVKGLRDRAMVALLYDSGLRAAELCRLRVEDVDLECGKLRVLVKGGGKGEGCFGEVTARYLREWLEVRGPNRAKELFLSVGGIKRGTKLTPSGLRVIIRKLGQKCDVKKLSPHAFRRGFAVSLSMQGVPDNILKDLGRWESTGMIKQYTRAQRAWLVYQSRAPMDNLDS